MAATPQGTEEPQKAQTATPFELSRILAEHLKEKEARNMVRRREGRVFNDREGSRTYSERCAIAAAPARSANAAPFERPHGIHAVHARHAKCRSYYCSRGGFRAEEW
eukprot:GFKZ01006636.1.p2 GENE.GFKZ01006636.1~~GFKZ01006636.1.p2  ORF type:complete len:107 (-),score=9.99 GFKZ01006636.1:461-781(-)